MTIIVSTNFVDVFFGGRCAKSATSMLPMVIVTLWEDTLRPTSPQLRLAATAVSCLFSFATLQVCFTRADVAFVDPWAARPSARLSCHCSRPPASTPSNKIDSFNGLCGGIVVAALLARI